MTRRLLLIVGLLFLCAVPAGAAKERKWYELRSEHFHVLTDGSPKKAVRITRKLEEFRFLLSQLLPGLRLDPPVPTTVLLFRNAKSIRPYQRVGANGKPLKNAGFMLPGRERMYLVVDTSKSGVYKTAFHEFVHLVMHLTAEDIPVWLNEGIAEFYEETEIRGRNFKIGYFNEGWLRLLQRKKLIPFDVLQEADHDSEYYTREKLRQVFYAQSWALVHFLMTENEQKRQSQLGKYLNLTAQGTPTGQAFRAAFEAEPEEIRKEFKDYLRQNRFRYFTGKLKAEYEPKISEPSLFPPVVAEAFAVDLWLNAGRLDEAEEALRRMEAAGQTPPEVLYRLGRLHLRRRQWEEAGKYFQAALADDPDDLSARYYAAMMISLNELSGAGDAESRRPAADRMIELLTPVVEQSRNFSDAFRMLVMARTIRGDAPAELIPLVEKLKRANLQEANWDFLLASLYIRASRWDEAEKVYLALSRRELSARLSQQVQQSLEGLQRRRESAQPARRPEAGQGPADNARSEAESDAAIRPTPGGAGLRRSGGSRRNMPVTPRPAAPVSPPKMAYLRGRLVDVACDGGTAVLTVRRKSSESDEKGEPAVYLRLSVPSLEHLLVMSGRRAKSMVECGATDANVGINYRVQLVREGVVGVVVSLEFNPVSL